MEPKAVIRIFTGWDQREAAGWHAFAQSVIERATQPVALTPLAFTDMQRDGTNAFTYSRFLVPYLCGFNGHAIFMDGADMIAMGDVAELWEMRDGWHPVKCVKHDYKTKHATKYRGTEMESGNADYPRKNWSSVMLFDCGHYMNRTLTPEFIAKMDGAFLHRLTWAPDERIGELPAEWNWLCDEYGANTKAKLLHWTAGIPSIYAYRHAPHAQAWQLYSAKTMQSPAERRIAEVASAR